MAAKRIVSHPVRAVFGKAGIVLAAIILLAVTLGASFAMRPTPSRAAPVAAHERFLVQRGSTLPELEGGVTGFASCKHVAVSVRPGDSEADRTRKCASTCDGLGLISQGATVETIADVVTCKCCMPGTRVELARTLSDARTKPCIPGQTFGMKGDGSQVMYVKNGCKGLFAWMDGRITRCESENVGDHIECPYYDSSVSASDRRHALLLAEKQLHTAWEAREAQRVSAAQQALQSDLQAVKQTGQAAFDMQNAYKESAAARSNANTDW